MTIGMEKIRDISLKLGVLGKKKINQIRRFSHQTRRLAEKSEKNWAKIAKT
jgi:hypothetical protein